MVLDTNPPVWQHQGFCATLAYIALLVLDFAMIQLERLKIASVATCALESWRASYQKASCGSLVGVRHLRSLVS
jgi:uncharacterized membrane protein